jgi:hypothetical protein
VSAGSSPITSPPPLPKHAKSKGPSLHPVSGTSQVLLPSPTPAQASISNPVVGHDPTPRTGLPRYPRSLPNVPSSLPRWTKTSASFGFFLVSLRPSPYIGRVGIHNCTFEASSRFTLVMARRFAAPLSQTSVPGASARWSPSPTVQVATEMNRQFLGRNSHPLASCIFVAHQYLGVPIIFCRNFEPYLILKIRLHFPIASPLLSPGTFLHCRCPEIFPSFTSAQPCARNQPFYRFPIDPLKNVQRSLRGNPLRTWDLS